MHFIKYLNNLSVSPLAVPAVQRTRRVTVTVRRTLINRKMLTFFLWGGATLWGCGFLCRNMLSKFLRQPNGSNPASGVHY